MLNSIGDKTIRKPNRSNRGPRNEGPRINEAIFADEVRVVGEDGEMLGVVSVPKALEMAKEADLDLVEVSPNANPPVCKILKYSKFKFEQQKKAAQARKNQKTVAVKEVKIRPGTEEHDYQVKLRNARRFLEKGDKVKVTMRFRGREMAHQDIGLEVLKRLQGDLADVSKVDLEPKREGRQMIMVLSSEVGK